MNAQAEHLLLLMRKNLRVAHELESAGQSELAKAYGAIAANKLAQAIHIDGKVTRL